MVTLKRPDVCQCGSSRMLREKNPERWICVDCKSIIVSRKLMPDNNFCRSCGISRDNADFKAENNLCKKCARDYMKQYYSINNEKQLNYKREYYQQNRELMRERANNYYQANVEIYLKNLLRRTLLCSKKRDGGRRRDLGHDIDFGYLNDMYKAQDGKCAITGLAMIHKWNSPYSMSCDRIDSSIGYIKGNVQLVCQWVNLAKNTHSNDDIKVVLDDYYSLRKSEEAI
jgi:hypothetical protein